MSNVFGNLRTLGCVRNIQHILQLIIYFIKEKAINSYGFFYVYTYIRVIIGYNQFLEKNGLVILSIIRGAIGPKGVKKTETRPAIGLKIGPIIRLATKL